MVSSKIVVKNPNGLHLRPAGLFCKIAIEFRSKITIAIENTRVNGKSVLSVLGACIKTGDEIEIICEGEDEEKALAVIIKAVEGGLGDEI
ncbi:HPr family phosphocarrier protein [Anaerocolumna chitinilytica]|jgi:phosphocarrier protein|uniref:Phosphocarrier protein HPr n=1 Tax=Anaerocolumna chitinilytica TaxID=1727145 RepID=A0A7I8DGI2_9FIRM|nr:HPr family phosphocarrier protein [Anaerocolumna chitinilytica]BCJ97623.1 phosphocarrier protein HPr [Anaerocolumna chitinilytica]